MKRFLSIICIIALMLCSTIVSVSAADFKLVADAVTGKPGDTVTLKVTLEGNADPGLTAFQYSVAFDEAKFSFVKAIASSVSEDDDEEDFNTFADAANGNKALGNLSCVTPMPNAKSPLTLAHVSGTKNNKRNGLLLLMSFKINEGVVGGTYPIALTAVLAQSAITGGGLNDLALPTVTNGSITVEGSTPTTTPKTVSYTAANGTVFASLAPVTSFGEGAPVASGTIKTAGTDPEEAVYFYFFPNKGYTVEGMTIDGEPTIGSDISRKFTVTADKEFTFSFAKIADGATPALAAVTGATTVKEATQFATFGTATGASDFGIIIAKGDTLKDEAGLKAAFEKASETGAIRKYAAEDANADGQFAIEVNGPLFAKGGTYIARMYAANGGNVTFGEIIDIAIAE